MLLQSVKYLIDDIHLPVKDIFLRSTRFCKLSENSHNAAYEFLHNTNVRTVLSGLGSSSTNMDMDMDSNPIGSFANKNNRSHGVGRYDNMVGGTGTDIKSDLQLDYKLLKNVYTLTATYTIDYDKEWQDIFSKQQYNLFEEHGEYILGYLIVHKTSDFFDVYVGNGSCGVDWVHGGGGGGGGGKLPVKIEIDLKNNSMRDTNYIHYIDYIDTRVRGYQLGALMIKYYEAMFAYGTCPNGCIACLPFKIDHSSVVYWRKYLEKHNVFTSDDIHYIIKHYGIFGIVNWDLLLTEYDNINITIWRK